MAIYFTSDTHFGHKNICKYCNRPWSNVDEMNEGLVQRWNSRVTPEDTVNHLGDFALGGKKNLAFRRRLNGRIILVKGNHDWSTADMLAAGFDEVHYNRLVKMDGKKVYMSHIPHGFPDHVEGRKHNPKFVQEPPKHDIYLCGHVHEKWSRVGNTINVGVDASDFYPLTLQELLTRDKSF
jgi:calcineurin-like phosphoesterase family protein